MGYSSFFQLKMSEVLRHMHSLYLTIHVLGQHIVLLQAETIYFSGFFLSIKSETENEKMTCGNTN